MGKRRRSVLGGNNGKAQTPGRARHSAPRCGPIVAPGALFLATPPYVMEAMLLLQVRVVSGTKQQQQ